MTSRPRFWTCVYATALGLVGVLGLLVDALYDGLSWTLVFNVPLAAFCAWAPWDMWAVRRIWPLVEDSIAHVYGLEGDALRRKTASILPRYRRTLRSLRRFGRRSPWIGMIEPEPFSRLWWARLWHEMRLAFWEAWERESGPTPLTVENERRAREERLERERAEAYGGPDAWRRGLYLYEGTHFGQGPYPPYSSINSTWF